jgi:hypothetical protein
MITDMLYFNELEVKFQRFKKDVIFESRLRWEDNIKKFIHEV